MVDLYRKDITPKEAFENLEFLKYSKDYYRKKGTGRPTKKDSREIDDIPMQKTKFNKSYWEHKYEEKQTGWDIGYISTPIKTYINQLKIKIFKILIPGGGN